jgi:AcrR family transcriptional regulator
LAADTRDRIVFGAATLMRRQGYTGTGIKQIASEAQAPFGSLYHFFPGGKEELGAEVVRRGGYFFQVLVMSVFDDAPDLITGVRDCFEGAAETLRATDYQDACPIATIALEVASTNERLRTASADVFASWIDAAVERYEAAGIEPGPARELACSMIMSLEGAFLLSRAMRTTEPLEIAGRSAVVQAETALGLESRPLG